MRNKRIKQDSSSSDSSESPLILGTRKKKKVSGVSDATLKKTEKIVVSKKLAGFSKSLDDSTASVEKKDLLFDMPSTISQFSYRITDQIEEIDLYKEYKNKVLGERKRAKEVFLKELDKMWKKEGKTLY